MMPQPRQPVASLTAQQLASAAAHTVATDLILNGVNLDQSAHTEVADDANDFVITIEIRRRNAPRLFVPMVPTPEVTTTLGVVPRRMPPRYMAILEILDPVIVRKGAWIAAKLRKAYSGSFRAVLSDLVHFGAVKKVPGGYILTKRPDCPRERPQDVPDVPPTKLME